MKVSCSGWRRTVLDHDLIEGDISHVKPSENTRYYAGEIYIEVKDRKLAILSRAENLHLSGDYFFRISLSRNEIANLAMVAFGKKQLSGVIDALSKVRSSKDRRGQE